MIFLFRLVILHLTPVAIVLGGTMWPRAKVASRVSAIFLGEGDTCECGPGGHVMLTPHACPKIGDTPDVVISHKKKEVMVTSSLQSKVTSHLLGTSEDPHRLVYFKFYKRKC